MSTFLTEVNGFTPLVDVLVKEEGLMTAAVYGVVWRYCQMKDRVCTASPEKIAGHVGASSKTVRRHIKILVEKGYLVDLTPDVKHKPHTYADAGRAKITGLVTAKVEGRTESLASAGGTESPTSDSEQSEVGQKVQPGGTESPTRLDRESNQGWTESPTKRVSYDTTQDREEETHASAGAEELPVHSWSWSTPTILCHYGQDPLGDELITEDPDAVTCPECLALLARGKPRLDQLLFGAIAWTCQWDLQLLTDDQRGQINQCAGKLRAMKNQTVTCEDIVAFRTWWEDQHWVGRNGDPPRPDQIRKEWGRFRSWQRRQIAQQKEEQDARRRREEAQRQAEVQAEEMDPHLKQALDVWRAACTQLEGSMTQSTFTTWIRPLEVLKPNGTFRLSVPNQPTLEWLENRLRGTVERALRDVVGRKVDVEFVLYDGGGEH